MKMAKANVVWRQVSSTGWLSLNPGRCFEQTSCIRVLRIPGDLLGGSDFDDRSPIHHGDAVRQIANQRHGVGDEQVRQAELALQLCQEINDLRRHTDIEGGDGFIGHHELRPEGQSAGDADSLPLPAAEFVREALHGGWIEAHGVEQFGGTSTKFGSRQLLVDNQRLTDNVFNPHARIEGSERILKDDLHVATRATHVAARGGQPVPSLKNNGSVTWLYQPQDEPAQSALPRPRLSNLTKGFAGLDIERHIVHGTNLAPACPIKQRFAQGKGLAQMANFKERHEEMVQETSRC